MELEHHQKVRDYLASVCSQIKRREIHEPISQELLGHIQDTAEELVRAGFSEEEAVEKAIIQMGDADGLGKQLHRTHRPRFEWRLLAIVAPLIGLGLLALYAMEVNHLIYSNTSQFTSRLVFLLLGVLVAISIYLLDYRRFKSYSRFLYAGTLLMSALFLIGSLPNRVPTIFLGAVRVNINFIEASPYFFIVALAGIFSEWDWDQPGGFVKASGLIGVPLFLYLAVPSLSAAIVFVAAGTALALFSGAKRGQVFTLTAVLAVVAMLYLSLEPYRLDRFFSFLYAHRDPQGSGYIYLKTFEAIHSAGLWGQGFTFPSQHLPAISNELIFAYLVYTFGWVVGIAIAALVVTFIVYIAKLAGQTSDSYGRLLVIGVVSIFAVQFAWNILMTLGFAPITGMTLPFVSYSGLHLLMQMAGIGFILSVYGRKNMVRDSRTAQS
ncbi:MAG: FtsW/RodA/SpoVE family cell cycle protein [Firmicutes bacterium]|nr:FtsW/RodA/SpoVE family cell cycle protein [Bacillota bacterium]